MPVGIIAIEIIDGKKNPNFASSVLYFDSDTNLSMTKKEFIKLYGEATFNAEYGHIDEKANNEGVDIVGEIVKEAKKLGANGIIGFSMSRTYNPKYKVFVHYASGFAVIIQ